MSAPRQLVARVRELFARRRLEREFDEEMRFHLDMETELNRRAGMTTGEAHRAAVLAFGGLERMREDYRDARGVRLVEELRQDVAYALRAARRAPAFTAVVLLTLSLGIGATTAIFTVVRGVLLRELPFAEPDRLVRVWASNPSREDPRGPLSLPEFEDWRRQATALERVAAYATSPSGLVLVDGGEPVRLRTAYVSEDFFATLGVRAQVGRAILPADLQPGRDRVVVIADALWRSRFAASPDVVGRTLRLNDEPYVVVGVMPAAVRFPTGDVEAWAPHSVIPATGIPRVRGNRWLDVVARLGPGVGVERARADLATIARRHEAEFRDTNAGWTGAVVVPLHDDLVGGVRARLLVIFGAVVLVLALACVNVANLVLARSASRERELAVRTALGAGRGRIARQLLTESMFLGVAGGALGLALAAWGARAVVALTGRWLPPSGEVRLDWAVLLFGLALSVATGIAFGLIPATRVAGIAGTLRESGRGATGHGPRAHRLRRTFVALELGLAVMLVAGAGLFVKSFARLNRVALGFDAERVAYVKVTIPSSRYATPAQYLPVARRMVERVRAIPGVVEAAAIKDAPFRGPAGEHVAFTIPGQPIYSVDEAPRANLFPVTPDYFRTMGIALRAGRDLTERDGDTLSAGAVVSETVARRHWPTRDAVGAEMMLNGRRVRVVGVAADARYTRLDSASFPAVYVPQALMTRRIVTIVARTAGDPAALVPALRAAIREVERDQPITDIGTMRSAVADAVAAPRFLTALVALFGVLALVLATVGVYGVVSYVVGQRTGEIGLRMALGAQRRDIVAWTLRAGLAPVLLGLSSGIVGALAVARLLAAQLHEVSPSDPGVFLGVAALLATVSLLASGIPAVRAARVDPTVALRGE